MTTEDQLYRICDELRLQSRILLALLELQLEAHWVGPSATRWTPQATEHYKRLEALQQDMEEIV